VPIRYLLASTVVRRTLQENDILIETAGGSPGRPTGRTMLINERVLRSFDGPVTCASFARFLRPDPKIAHPGYIYWYLQELYRSGLIEQYQVQHTGVARFQYTDFAATRLICLPALSEQQAIAEVLGPFDDKIAANSVAIATADKLAGALTRSSLRNGDFTVLETEAQITMGSSPPGASYNEAGEGVVFYQGVRDFGVRYPANRVWTTAPVRYAEAKDCLVSVRAPVGELNLAAERTCIGRGIAAVRSTTGAPMTLFHLLRDAPEVWAPYEAEGTIFGSINKNQLESLRLPRIRPDRAASLEQELSALENLIENMLSESAELRRTRHTLLPLLMSGKLRVRDAEKKVEAVV
jgi:type I restriction enzyme S subunit